MNPYSPPSQEAFQTRNESSSLASELKLLFVQIVVAVILLAIVFGPMIMS